ncbi:hypothetical protein ACNS7O_12610 [Haloferacaceae archaeon DSL9]
MDLDTARDDAVVAVGAGASTVLLSLVLRFGFDVDANVLLRLSPLVVYFAYLVLRDRLPDDLGAPGTWVGLSALVAAAALLVAVF